MPIELSRGVARFNKRVNNPIQRQYAWLLPPWSLLVHRGRKSGRVYRTPVNAYRKGDHLAVPILYGENSDWVRNILAGDAQVVRGGRTYELRDARVLTPEEAAGVVSAPGRAMGRMSGKLLVAEMVGPQGGFGRGPAAHG